MPFPLRRATGSLAVVAGLLLPFGTVRAQRPNELSLTGGSVMLGIDTAVPGFEAPPVSDSGTSLLWSRPNKISKIVVSTTCTGQSFALSVEAIGVTSGLPAGPIELTNGMFPTDFVVGIPKNQNGQGSLRYTATALVEQGSSASSGTDDHVIVYTLIEQ